MNDEVDNFEAKFQYSHVRLCNSEFFLFELLVEVEHLLSLAQFSRNSRHIFVITAATGAQERSIKVPELV